MQYSKKPWQKRWWGVAAIIFLSIILIFLVAFGLYLYNSVKIIKNSPGIKLTGQTYPAAADDLPAGQAGHYWLGAAKAPITIVEFGDFACPFSEQAFPTVREISLKYKNDIKFIWRDYPVVQEYSALLALAGRCAGEQGLFWPMHDKLFQNQGVSSADQLSALANQVGADLARFNDCMNKQKYLPQIKKDLSDGQTFNINGTPTYINGTPTFFINGYKIEGNIPYDIFIKIIDGLK